MYGILTGLSFRLHYVRNHGPVPQLAWETHRLAISSDPPGLISNPKEFTMDELAGGAFRIYEFPVTIACDGSESLSYANVCID